MIESLASANITGISDWIVVVLGLVTVFIGLICIILICKLTGLVCAALVNNKSTKAAAADAPVSAGQDAIPNRQQFIAAVSAAIAEDLGTDVTNIRILSVKKL